MTGSTREPAVTIRVAQARDGRQLHEVAELDSSTVPAGEVLVAECDGRILAAVSLAHTRVVADPFRPTADLVELLLARARQLNRSAESSGPSGRAVPPGQRLLAALGTLTPRIGALTAHRR